jgi:hopene-associated glycosyltransferase HpnB
MVMFRDVAGAVALLAWIYLLAARSEFWQVSLWLAPVRAERAFSRSVVAVVPARNEAAVVGEAIGSLLRQELPTPMHVVLVDDGSADDTIGAARRAADACGRDDALTIIRGRALQPGWTGKVWALSQGIADAEQRSPDYLLLTDADIRHAPSNVATLIERAESGYDLVSYMSKLSCVSIAERLLVPAFVFFFFMLYPPAWIRSPRHATAGAAGGCVLVRPDLLTRVGGIASIRGEVIDDCALALAVKRAGGRVWLGLSETAHSVRRYETFGELIRMISRTAFNQLRHSTLLLALTLVGLTIVYLLPPLLFLHGRGAAPWFGGIAWAVMAITYAPIVRFYEQPLIWSLTLPVAAAFYGWATLASAVAFWRGEGGAWKGRAQDTQR